MSSSTSWVTSRNPDANNIFAIAGVVVKEMYRRKDFYVLLVLIVLITLMLGSVSFFDDDRIVRYLKDACLLLIWLSSLVIAITTAARQIPAERESRTIYPLLAKPVGRGEFVAGKFLGCWVACGIALVGFYFFFGIMSASREHTLPFLVYFQAIWLHWMCLGIVVALVLLGSVVFAAPSSNATSTPWRCKCAASGVRWSMPFITPSPIWNGMTCGILSSITGGGQDCGL
jgi:ABC-type transport system involved in multi-copper enzyme maturation permease subunit